MLPGVELSLDAGSAAIRSGTAAPNAWHIRLKLTRTGHRSISGQAWQMERSKQACSLDLATEAETGSALSGQRNTKPSSSRMKSYKVNRPDDAPLAGRAGATRSMSRTRVSAILSADP